MKYQLLIIFLLSLSFQSNINYSPDIATDLLYYSKISYCDAQEIQNWVCDSCQYYQDIQDIYVVENPKLETQSYQAYSLRANQIIIAFRGSHNAYNWKSNLEIQKTSYDKCSKCSVHKGFYEVWQQQSQQVLENVKALKMKHPNSSIVITGHSLGGTTAIFAGLELASVNMKATHLYTFGMPRIGNKQFSQYAHKVYPDQFRVVNKRDPVPHVPLSIMFYNQIPQEIWYDSDSENGNSSYIVCKEKDVKEDSKCSNSIKADYPSDHLQYLGYSTGCKAHGITPQHEQDYFQKNWQNFILQLQQSSQTQKFEDYNLTYQE